ncbi:hypothetical protein ASG99_23295 [Bacillus sp. Soil768D1]|nr:hypothetical protein ASG99_23295 [Bacillus sp. Soil768D1]
MKRLLKISIMSVLVFSFFSFHSTTAEAASTEKAFVKIKSGTLTVRSKASDKAKKMGLLKKGAKVSVSSTTDSGRSKISYKKKKAYVATK